MVCISVIGSHDFRVLGLEPLFTPSQVVSGQGGNHLIEFGSPWPSIVQLSAQFDNLRQLDDPFRVLWLPQENEVTNEVGFLDPSGYAYNFLSNNYLIGYYSYLLDSVKENITVDSGKLLADLGFKYIVVLKFLNQTYQPSIWGNNEHIVGSPNDFINYFNNQTDLVKVEETSDYIVYCNEAFTSMVYASTEMYAFNVSQLQDAASTIWPVVAANTTTNRVYTVNATTALTSSQQAQFSIIGTEGFVQTSLLSWEPSTFTTEYDVEINSSKPVYIVLEQNYDDAWKAYIDNSNGTKTELQHFLAQGWDNGYYSEKNGTYLISIQYTYQSTFTLTLVAQFTIVTTLILILIFTSNVVRNRFVKVFKHHLRDKSLLLYLKN